MGVDRIAISPHANARGRPRRKAHRWRAREAPDGAFIMFADGSLLVMSLLRLSPAGQLSDPRAERWQWVERLRATARTASD